MRSLWSDTEASGFPGDLSQRVYTSQLLGRDPSLVLHGGGNTSVKITEKNVFGDEEEILYVKGSGWDLETIEAEGFAPCRMGHLLRLAELPELSDTAMARELRACLTDPGAPSPSVEAILHASLPYTFVDHTHTDALISICNTPSGEQRIRDVYGDSVVVVPYVMPGFKLARLCAQAFPQQVHSNTIGMVLMNHGLFSFGETARESYDRMIELVARAQRYLGDHDAWQVARSTIQSRPARLEIAALRNDVAKAAGFPVVMTVAGDGFAAHPDIAKISQQGPATPDHVLRTKRLPLLGRDVAGYATAYRTYFEAHGNESLRMLDPAPRVILDPDLGMCAVGRTAKDARIVADIYEHTIDIILRATALERWQALPPDRIFEVEYWDLEQAKLTKAGNPPLFAGEVALVTGAASGIGKACVESFLARGAAVIGLDISETITELKAGPAFAGIVCDVTNADQVDAALEEGVRAFGGLDMLVLNAGIFPPSSTIAEMTNEMWRQVMAVNLDANLALMRSAHPLLKLAPGRGRVAVVGSKNVPAPGPGVAAYSVSKAAVNQLARVAALEWGGDGIRINSLHPNMVFDTGIWTDDVLEARARHYGLTVEEYRTNNVLRTPVTSADVAELVAAVCSPLFAKTTGAQVAVDGGNDRVI